MTPPGFAPQSPAHSPGATRLRDDLGGLLSANRAAFGAGIQNVRIRAVERLPRGSARETWVLHCRLTDARTTWDADFVFRRDLPGGFNMDAVDLDFEYGVYRRLRESSIPVAHTVFFSDAGPDGLPCYLRQHIDGDWQVPHLSDPDPAFDPLRIAVSQEHLRALAAVHTCDWRGLGFAEIMTVPPSPGRAALTTLELHVERLRRHTAYLDPIVTLAIARLEHSAPDRASSIGLCKGTNGLGEEIFRDGRIVAMSDWELAVIGDPAYDFAMLQDLIPHIERDGVTLWSEQHALEFYRQVCGIRIDPATLSWYRALNGLVKYGYTHQCLVSVVNRTFPSARTAWVASEVHHRSLLMLGDLIGMPGP